MQIKIFTIPIMGGEALNEEMNVFLRSKKVLQVEERLMGSEPDRACWCYSVRYVDDVAAAERERVRVDYREVLDAPTFRRFSAMREIRKRVSQDDGVPPYVVFTDYELAELAKLETIFVKVGTKNPEVSGAKRQHE